MLALRSLPLVVVFSLSVLAQAEWPKPNWEKVNTLGCRASDKPVSTTVGKYQIKLVPVPDLKTHESLCRSYLVGPTQTQHGTLVLEDWNVSVHQGTGDDLFEDGSPTLVLEGYSGGAHCCYTYEIVSLGDRPVILQPIRNEAPFYIFRDSVSKQFRIMTSDGAFDSFDGMCHACAPFPRVVLRVDNDGLHDVSAQFVEQYDSEIALARAKIAQEDIAKFQITDFKDAKGVVLEIVLSYVYSGREADAWQTLGEMWPADDRARVKQLIMRTRAKGLLSRLSTTAPRTSTVTSGR